MEPLRINDFDFTIISPFEHIDFDDTQYGLLKEQSGLTNVLLCSNWWKQKYRLINFTGTTNEEAIKKILIFYKHKTFRRLIGDHVYFEGFTYDSDGNTIINLGS